MKKITKGRNVSTNGTSLQGYVWTTYDKLVELLGEPNAGPSGDGKVNCEWLLDIDGTVCTIYDWKLSSIPKDLYCWHIGGKDETVLDKVEEALGLAAFTHCSIQAR
jgi:hypothetical protein